MNVDFGILRELNIENFKCFGGLRVPFAPLTVLSGFNGGGKSTALQPLLLMAQGLKQGAFRSGIAATSLPLNGELARLGTVGDIFPNRASEIRFEIITDQGQIDLRFSGKAGARNLDILPPYVDRPLDRLIGPLARFSYLSAVRSGPMEAFPAPDLVAGHAPDVGMDGRYASYWYHELADTEVEVAKRCPDQTADTFRKQLDAWLARLAPGASANVQALPVSSSFALQFRLSEIGEWRRPANVGYGLTYAFPIIVALLAARAGDIISIDSPEAHLHPHAQSQMGRMLATFAAAGIQIIVETHSDHVLNGIRIAVRDKILAAKDTSLLFFSGVSPEGHGVTRPRVDDNGRINEWPDGFFDQSEKDVANLAGWN